MVTLTNSAAAHIKKVLDDDGAVFFKIKLSEKGCSGFSYVMSTGKTAGDDCIVYECGSVMVSIPKSDESRLGGVEIDWVRDGLSSRLSINNPEVVNSCGCGSSVMFKRAM